MVTDNNRKKIMYLKEKNTCLHMKKEVFVKKTKLFSIKIFLTKVEVRKNKQIYVSSLLSLVIR